LNKEVSCSSPGFRKGFPSAEQSSGTPRLLVVSSLTMVFPLTFFACAKKVTKKAQPISCQPSGRDAEKAFG
jgi:hypothetical protein